MSALVSPLHVAAIDGVDVRFFEAPRDRLELPWHAVDDKAAASAIDSMNKGYPVEERFRRAMEAARNTLGVAD